MFGLDSFVVNEITNLCKFLLTVILVFGVLWLIMLITKFIVFKIWEHNGNDDKKSFVRTLIYDIDKFGDNMSDKQKRQEAINSVKELFSWRGIKVPTFIVGWIIDMEVAAIRKLQSMSSKDCNLHPDNCEECELDHKEEEKK